jgi:hypothetical protein
MQKELVFKGKVTAKKLELGKSLANKNNLSVFTRIALFLKSGGLIKVTKQAVIFL